jgi:hypothetical protein
VVVDGAYAISSAARVAIVASSATAAVGREARLAGGVTAWACTSTGAGGGDGGDDGGGGGLEQPVPSVEALKH